MVNTNLPYTDRAVPWQDCFDCIGDGASNRTGDGSGGGTDGAWNARDDASRSAGDGGEKIAVLDETSPQD